MIVFWILAGGLAVLALAFVLVPLLRRNLGTPDPDSNALNLGVFRQQIAELDGDLALGKLDQTQYDSARHDLERELIHDLNPAANGPKPAATAGGRWAAPILALAVPAAAVALYLSIGAQGIIPKLEAATAAQQPTPQAPPGHAAASTPDGRPMPSLDVLAQQLAERLEKEPNNPTGWVMLARTWSTLGQKDKAMSALERGYKIAPRSPEILLAYAEALAEANGRQLAGRPAELLDAVLETEPGNPNGLWLRGLAAFQTEDYQGALTRWEPLLARLDPAGQDAAEVSRLTDEARSRAGLPAVQVAEAATPVAPTAATGAQVPPSAPEAAPAAAKLTVSVALDPALAAQVPADATVFVYAKAVAGPPMPLAAKRVKASDLPLTLILDDSMAMMPQMRLSAFPQVTVGARISRSGQAMPQSGDLEGEVSPVASGRIELVAVTIARVRP
jgi:cytochrome c-type biogenesis protein CcmH